MKRRQFLKTTGDLLGFGVMGLLAQSCLPQEMIYRAIKRRKSGEPKEEEKVEPHFFVHVQVEGGADMVQSLDPMFLPKDATEEDLWLGFNENEIIQTPFFDLGPAASALVKHAQDMALIRGIRMDMDRGSTHEFCRVYMGSGFNGSRSRSRLFIAEHARINGTGFSGAVVNTAREWWVKPNDIPYSLTGDLLESGADMAQVSALLDGLSSPFGGDLMPSRSSFVNASKGMARFNERIAELKQQKGTLTDLEIFAEAFATGVALQGMFNLGGDFTGPGPGLDAHVDMSTHLEDQKWHWDHVSEIFDVFKSTMHEGTGKSLFELTTFYVTNEFSRPPAINSVGGKDHNPDNNTVILAGKGITGGVAVGGTELFLKSEAYKSYSSWSVGAPIDYQSGRKIDRLETSRIRDFSPEIFIRPENVIATLLEAHGIPLEQYSPISERNVRSLPVLI